MEALRVGTKNQKTKKRPLPPYLDGRIMGKEPRGTMCSTGTGENHETRKESAKLGLKKNKKNKSTSDFHPSTRREKSSRNKKRRPGHMKDKGEGKVPGGGNQKLRPRGGPGKKKKRTTAETSLKRWRSKKRRNRERGSRQKKHIIRRVEKNKKLVRATVGGKQRATFRRVILNVNGE